MTSHELAQLLLRGKDLPVHFAYNYGDYWHTTVTQEVESVEVERVTDSAYHRTTTLVTQEDLDAGKYENAELTEVIVLSR